MASKRLGTSETVSVASDDVQRIAVDAELAAAVRNQVRAFRAATPGLVLIPGHDLAGLPTNRPDLVLHHPEWFAVEAWPISSSVPEP